MEYIFIDEKELSNIVDRLGQGAMRVANALLDAAKKEWRSHERDAIIRERWTILDALFEELG